MRVDRRGFLAGTAALGMARMARAASPMGSVAGPVKPEWQSLVDHYRVPDWFRDAKFGLWAHWGPQSVPEQGDWYGRLLYMQGQPDYAHHLKTYGHPSVAGMKDIQHLWRAERWDPEALIARYAKAGAKYFMALACHHDNFDCFDSRYHNWNAVNVGPKRDIIGSWEPIVRRAGLKFGVSNHSSHAWHWYAPAYAYDPEGPMKGVRYDAWRLTKADGKGQWWDGLDPQELYTGRHFVAPAGIDTIAGMDQWHDENDGQWLEIAPPNDPAYVTKWLLRQTDLVAKYKPDLVYFDDTMLPFGQVGLEAVADYYNRAIGWHGAPDVVVTAKKLIPLQRHGIVEDVERGFTDHIWDVPWQTDTCIGDWFYNIARLKDKSYKTAEEVIQRLADVVSKNGNLLLSIPLPGYGAIDAQEEQILDEITAWMAINDEAIFGSRPWRVYGDGPTTIKAGVMNEGKAKPFTAEDVRFTTNRGALYALFLGWPEGAASIAPLGRNVCKGEIARVTLLGGGPLPHRRDGAALHVDFPPNGKDGFVPVLRIEGRGLV